MITYNDKTKTFRMDTANTTYCMTISQKGYLAHTYYGSKIGDDDVSYLTRQMEYPFADSSRFIIHSSLSNLRNSHRCNGCATQV